VSFEKTDWQKRNLINRFYVSRKPYGSSEFRRLLYSIPLSPTGLSSGAEFSEGGVRLSVLAPENSIPTRLVANDDSIVLMLDYQGKRILLTGDAEAPTEEAEALIRRVRNAISGGASTRRRHPSAKISCSRPTRSHARC
jgi:beta-lactamase superfamily II metal-dependent hydrolase